MHITTEFLPGASTGILILTGEFETFEVALFEREIAACQAKVLAQPDNSKMMILLNMKNVRFINSTALGAILKWQTRLSKDRIVIAIFDPSLFVAEMAQKVGLAHRVPLFRSLEEALALRVQA